MQTMTEKEIKAWLRYHEKGLRSDPPRHWEPILKPVEETIDLACKMPELHLEHVGTTRVHALICAKLKIMGLPLRAVTAYVNYAGHNTLPIRELAKEMGVCTFTVVAWFKRFRQEWPQLFDSALCLERNTDMERKLFGRISP